MVGRHRVTLADLRIHPCASSIHLVIIEEDLLHSAQVEEVRHATVHRHLAVVLVVIHRHAYMAVHQGRRRSIQVVVVLIIAMEDHLQDRSANTIIHHRHIRINHIDHLVVMLVVVVVVDRRRKRRQGRRLMVQDRIIDHVVHLPEALRRRRAIIAHQASPEKVIALQAAVEIARIRAVVVDRVVLLNRVTWIRDSVVVRHHHISQTHNSRHNSKGLSRRSKHHRKQHKKQKKIRTRTLAIRIIRLRCSRVGLSAHQNACFFCHHFLSPFAINLYQTPLRQLYSDCNPCGK